MDQSYSESDISLSPSKIFERLQMLRQLQIMQRGKLQKQYSQYQDSPEISSSVTEIVSHFSNSTSYNTFRSLLQSSQEIHTEDNSSKADISPRHETHQDYIEGVSALNLSQESEFITNSPISSRSVSSKVSTTAMVHATDIITTIEKNSNSTPSEITQIKSAAKQISLDEMPILSPKKNFEELIIEKLNIEKVTKNKSPTSIKQNSSKAKKPFLRRGEGMTRFGIQKNDLVIQNTKTLPWRKDNTSVKRKKTCLESKEVVKTSKTEKPVHVQIVVPKPKVISPKENNEESKANKIEAHEKLPPVIDRQNNDKNTHSSIDNVSEANNNRSSLKAQVPPNTKHPVKTAKGQTWASVLTKEQDMFLRQLKQSDYYKNFVSPAKSVISDTSCNTTPLALRQERERAEQNMFELLENKVTHDSFNLNNSFFNRFLRKNNLECSGESTPVVLQKCLYDNPGLLHLHHEESHRNRNISCCDGETCSVLTEGSETCSSVSTCCSCKKGDPSSIYENQYNEEETKEVYCNSRSNARKEEKKLKENEKCPDDFVKKDDGINADMAVMNAKLIATSELLKDRLRELEDEIETFRKENVNLTKMREELDIERQKFYEEKTMFEQKYNEEKILSEYYLAEEKEKLNKQKQIYDRYVREMRGKLNKKEKEEVVSLKREITELKDEIRNKDAKSTATIARLRNQIKITEKERKALQDEIEKLKKENRRIQHSNDITRRLTNLKYLEQINKKLNHMSSKDLHSETDISSNQKYKAFEIERQSRIKKPPPVPMRRRAKSVPNLNVTSRYAKYFSKKDSASDKEANNLRDKELVIDNESDAEEIYNDNGEYNDSNLINDNDSGEENNLEKMYNERFQSLSPTNKEDDHSKNAKHADKHITSDGFFIQRTNSTSKSLDNSNKTSLSPYQANSSETSVNTSRSPISIPSCRSYRSSKSPINGAKLTEEYISAINQQNNHHTDTRPKSPVSILSNRLSGSQRTATVKDLYLDKSMIPSPEPTSSRTSASKTNLNPTEIRKPDGSRELRFPNGNVKYMSADGRYSKFVYYNGDIKENFYDEGRIKYFYAETKTYHTTHADGLEVLEFSDGQIEKRYKDGSSEIRLPNGSVRYYDPKNEHVREEWRFPDGAALTVSATGEQRIVFTNGQVEVHAKDHKRREFPDGTVKLVYNDGTSETRYASGRVRIKDKHGNLIMDSAPG